VIKGYALFRRVGLLLTLALSLTGAQTPRGHWTGTMAIPSQPVDFQVDLDNPAGQWIGSIDIPSRKATGIPLEGIILSDGKWIFHIKGAPNLPTFTGILSEDGKSMSGTFSAGDNPVPFTLKREGEPKVELPKPSPPITESLIGEWGGGIDIGTMKLRLILKLANTPTGATAVLIAPDQGGSEIPVTKIQQSGAKLTLTVTAVGAELAADLDTAGTTLSGTWSQGGKVLPVSLKKAP
jgi:hypothetical protein